MTPEASQRTEQRGRRFPAGSAWICIVATVFLVGAFVVALVRNGLSKGAYEILLVAIVMGLLAIVSSERLHGAALTVVQGLVVITGVGLVVLVLA